MTHVSEIVGLCLAQDGDKYIFGHEVSPSDTNPSAFDCSELIQWACARAGVDPVMPDGSWHQARHCSTHGTLISVAEGLATRGALLFRFSSSPFEGGRPSSAHVALSLGDGTTIEAKGSKYGVGVFPATGRNWTYAGLIPGAEYSPVPDTTPEPSEATVSMNIELPVLRKGAGLNSKGQQHLQGDVRVLQGLLLAAGYPDPKTTDPRTSCDGKFGSGTESSVVKFQKSRNITIDGIVGQQSWGKLLNQ